MIIAGANAPHPITALRSPATRARRLLLVTVVLPLLFGLSFLVWRAGTEVRSTAGDELTLLAGELAARIRALELSQTATPRRLQNELESIAARRAAVYYSAPGDWRPVATTRLDTGNGLGESVRRRLESLDRPFSTMIDGRITAVAPVKDADQWDMLGAVIVQRTDADPRRLPLSPTLIAALAILLAVAIAQWAASQIVVPTLAGAARSGASDSVNARRFADRRSASPTDGMAGLVNGPGPVPTFNRTDHAGRAARVVEATETDRRVRKWVAPVLFIALAGAACFIVGRYETTSSGLWAIAVFVAWLVPAGIGLSLAGTVARPLQFREAAHAWTFLAPSLAHLLVFSLGPIVFSLWLSFHDWDLLSVERPFVGLANYRALAADLDFIRSLGNTAIYVLFVPIGMTVALGIALLMNRRIPGVRVLRAIFFLPYITSFVAISLVWRWMFQPDVGLLNGVLGRLGIAPQPWLSSPVTALPSLMLMSIWMYAGYMMIIFLAGLQSIPESLYESARIDGANAWQRFRHITIPMLRPTTLFLLVTMIIFMFQVFTAVYVMTEGGPLHATDVIVYHIYRNAWEYLRMGYASAMAWVLFAIVFVITLVQFRLLGGRPAQ